MTEQQRRLGMGRNGRMFSLAAATVICLWACATSAHSAARNTSHHGISYQTANETLVGRKAIRLRGEASTANNGGFLQIALDLDPKTDSFDAGSFAGLEIDVFGNHQNYAAHLRTAELSRPQQSYRQTFVTTPTWRTLQLPFVQFLPHRTEIPLNTTRLKRIGLVAIGREFAVDLSVARLAFY